MSAHKLRRAGLRDRHVMLQIEESCFSGDRISKRQMHYLLTKGKTFSALIEDDKDTIFGCIICLTPALPRAARIYSLAVLPEYRGQGAAQSLLAYVLKYIEKQGYKTCRLEVRKSQTEVQALYRRFGFQDIGQVQAYYEDGEDALKLELCFGQTLIK